MTFRLRAPKATAVVLTGEFLKAEVAKWGRVVKASGLVKTFGRVVGLNYANLELYPGEVLAACRGRT